jgi:hypothetical protein
MKKDIYFYWGNETMSYMRYMTLFSFCALNKGWGVYLIKNCLQSDRVQDEVIVEKQDKTEYSGPDYSEMVQKLPITIIEFNPNMLDLPRDIVNSMSDVHIKDLLNWKLLSTCGGIVADMDILFTKSIDESVFEGADVGLICFDGYPKKDYIPVSFMYSAGANAFFTKVYNKALTNYDPKVYECFGTMSIEEKNISEVKDNFKDLVVAKLHDAIVFPLINFPWQIGINMLYIGNHADKLHKDSAGIHWYGGAPLTQKFNNMLNEENVHIFDNTITIKMREVLCHNHSNQI